MFYYDIYGWLTTDILPDRATDVTPPLETETLKANWLGHRWVLTEYVAPPVVQPVIPPNPTEFLIDVGPFFDRFKASKMDVLTSQDAGVKAILADIQVRHWIDLKNPAVAQGVAYVASVVPSVTAELQNAILNDPVLPEENLVLRKLYF